MGHTSELISADGFRFNAYIAAPTEKPKGGLVLLQEIFGVNSHIRGVADSYAAEGYLVVAPALFDRLQVGVELGYADADMQTGRAYKAAAEALSPPGAMADVTTSIELAAEAGKVGVVGYCWGGLVAWRAACCLPGLSAAVPYYGGGMTLGDEATRQPGVPTLAHFADQDAHIPLPSVEAFKQGQPRVDVQIYAGQHGFNCDQRASYNAEAARVARERTLAFLAQHLR